LYRHGQEKPGKQKQKQGEMNMTTRIEANAASPDELIADLFEQPAVCPVCERQATASSANHVPFWVACSCGWEGDREQAMTAADQRMLAQLRGRREAERRELAARIEADRQAEAENQRRRMEFLRRIEADRQAEAENQRRRMEFLRSPQADAHLAAVNAEAARISSQTTARRLRQAADRLAAEIAAARA
jgi:hypothetical protein